MRTWNAERGAGQPGPAATAASPALGALAGAPLDFVVHALEAEGALVERGEGQESGDGRALAVLPTPAAARLGLPEECRLALSPAVAGAVDRLACEGCGQPTGRPAACDREMHLLCEGCAPQAQGRIACRACGRR